jgi:integrase
MKGVYRKHYGKSRLSRKYYVEFRDHVDRTHRTPAFERKDLSEEYLRKLRELVEVCGSQRATLPKDLETYFRNLPSEHIERIVKRFGLLDEGWLEADKPVADHVRAFGEHLLAKGRTARHAELYKHRVQRLIHAAGVKKWNQLTPAVVEKAWQGLTTRAGKPLAHGTRNHYLVAFKAFCRWMERAGRAATNPAKDLDPVRVTERKERKPFSAEEFEWLLRVTESGPIRGAPRKDGGLHFQMTGPQRALFYLFAVETGFRLGELNSLRVCDFDLSDERPSVQLRAGHAKNRKDTPPLPLRTALAARLRTQFAKKLPEAPAFNAPDSFHAARTVRQDMEDARRKWIKAGATPKERAERACSDFLSPVDHRGRVADFHALRSTTATWLAEAGVSPYAMQQLMRHADIKTTMAHYAKVRPDVTRAALEQLPPLRLTDAG